MRKNIIFTLFGIVCLMMPVDANAASCSYATNSEASKPSSDARVAGIIGPYMIDLRSKCSEDKIFYCDESTKGKFFYGSLEQASSGGSFIVRPSGEKSLYRCNYDEKNPKWELVKGKRNCCTDCWSIEFSTNTCNCRVYIGETSGWSLKKCGSDGPDIPSHWKYKECCDKISPTDYQKDGKTVYRCDEPGDYWTYKKCDEKSCDSLICTDATISGTVDVLPWSNSFVTQNIRNNIVYYNDDCSQAGSYYECSRTKNYYRYIWAEIGSKGNNFPWVVMRGKTRKLLFCDGTAWKELSQITDWKQMKCKKVLNHCGTFYTNDAVWSRNPCSDLNNNDGGNSECTGCCQDLPLHSDVSNAMDVLNNFASNASVNVWVNQDGKFNSARLATDIASGVVLGTIGGLVSNVIIKNNQIKDGMTGYHCTVGSNTVADYGDEFIIDFPE